jgi:2-hydroxy-3-oxopropionate reductase
VNATVGFIGLGIMGRPMARNLLAAGYDLVVSDIVPEAVEELVAAGARAAGSPAEVAARAPVVITVLPGGRELEDVVFSADGILTAATPHTILVDMSSVAPETAWKVAAALAEKGASCLDAPVSGGEPGAVSGELVIMAGGPPDVFAAVEPVFAILGKKAVRVGDWGAGQITKLANQLLVAAHIEVMAEALLLAVKAGVDPALVLEAVEGGLAHSSVLVAKGPMLLARDFTPGARIAIHDKDMKNILATAHELGLKLPVAELVGGMFDRLMAEGKAGLDHGGLALAVEELNGVEIRGRAPG